jgi:hypothetical protein
MPVAAQNNSQQPAANKPPARGQAATPAGDDSSARQAKIDPVKEADIRRLLELTGAKSMVSQVMTSMESSIKPLMMNSLPPGDYREKLVDLFFQEFLSRANIEMPRLLDAAIPVYDKYYSNEDIKGLIHFYETALGQKAISLMPKISTELQSQGTKLGETIGRDAMLKVLSDHPELKSALEDAEKSAHSQ